MMLLLSIYLATLIVLGMAIGGLHLLPRLGPAGRRGVEALSRAPLLDGLLLGLTMGPPAAALIVAVAKDRGWVGTLLAMAVALLGQYSAVLIWMRLHEWRHRGVLGGPRLVKSINALVGPWRNYLAVYWMLWAVPTFNLVRLTQYLVYPVLVWTVGLPRYRDAEWVNVSRHKFDGLVGSDRLWCLYCDWMTGVWSLGSEMLRNLESFWCPIRFRSDLKCENCQLDFPDVADGWVDADADLAAAAAAFERHYPGPQNVNGWFGHPVRLTVRGETGSAAKDAKSAEEGAINSPPVDADVRG